MPPCWLPQGHTISHLLGSGLGLTTLLQSEDGAGGTPSRLGGLTEILAGCSPGTATPTKNAAAGPSRPHTGAVTAAGPAAPGADAGAAGGRRRSESPPLAAVAGAAAAVDGNGGAAAQTPPEAAGAGGGGGKAAGAAGVAQPPRVGPTPTRQLFSPTSPTSGGVGRRGQLGSMQRVASQLRAAVDVTPSSDPKVRHARMRGSASASGPRSRLRHHG